MNGKSLGAAIQDIVADAVHKVIISALPHWHETKINHGVGVLESMQNEVHKIMGPMAQHALDTGAVHPLLEPLFRMMTGEDS